MASVTKILFPTDLSDRGCAAAPFVAEFMKHFGAAATLLHVVEPVPYPSFGDGPSIVVDLETLQDEAQVRLDQSLVKEFEGLGVIRRVETGFAASTICEFAERNGTDLIMMPTHGRGPFRSLLLGSVTAKVLHDATCPVWTATHTSDPFQKKHVQCRSILCAVDGSEASVPILRWVEAFARELGASLRLVHVVPGLGEWVSDSLRVQLETESREQARSMIEKLSIAAEIDAPICIPIGDVAPSIRKEAIDHGADALVIGRGVLHQTLGRLRTHSYQIIRTAPCPVISV